MNKFEKEPKVSIIITYYNLGDYVEESIESAINQTYKNLEIILVNDGSNEEKSIKKLSEIKNKYKNKIKFIDQKNLGVSAARNNGIKKSSGEFICCLDADDIISPSYIEKTAKKLQKNKKNGFVTTWVQEFGLRNRLWKTSEYNPELLLIENIICGCSLFKKEAWKKVKGYSNLNNSYEDWDFWIKIVNSGYRWGLVKEPIFLYRIRDNSRNVKINLNRNDALTQIVKNNLKFYKKNISSIISLYDKKIIKDVNTERENLTKIYKNKEILLNTERENLTKIYKNKEILLNTERENLTKKIESELIFANQSIVSLQNDIRKILNTKGWKYLEKIRNIKNKTKNIINGVKLGEKLKKISENFISKTSSQKIKFTIGIPVYNHSDYLKQCIDSCINQTYKNFEIIITDDKSPEKEVLPILKMYESKYKNTIKCIFHEKNQGITETINEQILNSNSDYYVFLDCDDFLENNALYEAYKIIVNNKNPDYIFTDRNHVDEKGNFLFKAEYGGYKKNFDQGLTLKEILPIGMAASHLKIIKNSFFSKAGLNSNYFSVPGKAGCQDYDFALRSLLEGGKFFYINKSLYNHRWHSKSVTFSNNSQQTQLSNQVQRLFQIRRYLGKIDNIYSKPKIKHKHILFIVPYLVSGGAERWLLNLSSYLKKNEFIISIFSTNGSGEWTSKAKKITNNVIIRDTKNTSQEKIIDEIIRYVCQNSVDIVHISNSETGYKSIEKLTGLYPKPKIIDTIHSDKSGFISFSAKYSSYIDHRITVSEIARKILIENNYGYQNRMTTIYNATNFIPIKTIQKKEKIITYIGRLSEEKNPEMFIKICNQISKKDSEFKFNIVGNGPLFQELEKNNKNKKISFLGQRDNLDVIYKKSKYILITSFTEGLPLVLAEAMSQGCIVISTPVGGIPEVINDGENGFLCSTIKDFSNTILRIESNNSLFKLISSRGIDTVNKKLSLDCFGKKYQKIYFDTLSDNSVMNTKQKLVSICILTLNRYKALDNLLKSIEKYTKLPHEILILDQDSDKETKKYLKQIKSKNIKIFYSKTNLGCSGGRKYLIKETKGDYIVQLDNDIEVKENWLEKLLASIEWNEEIGGACGRVTFPDGKTEYNGANYIVDKNFITYTLTGNSKNVNDRSLLIENYSKWLPGGATIFKKAVFNDETYDDKFLNGFEDNDLSFRLEKHGWKFVNCPSCVFIHNHRMFLSNEDIKREQKYIKQRNDFSRIKTSFLRFYEKHNLIINNPELWKLMNIKVVNGNIIEQN